MPTLLAFDTAAAHCAAVLVRDGRILAARSEPMARGQAEALMPLLQAMLAGAGLRWHDLDAIGVGIGPGNFTGTRIAVAAARGLSLGLGIPAIGLSTFEMMRRAAPHDDRPCLVSLPAPRERAYVQLWTMGAAGLAEVIDPAAPPPRLAHGAARVVGHRAAELALALGIEGHELTQGDVPSALARVIAAAWRPGASWPRPVPLYVRPADAAPPRVAPPVIVP